MAAYQTFNNFNLSQDQEDLLMAALASNQPASTNNSLSPPARDVFTFSNGSLESPLFTNSPPQNNVIMDTDFSTMTDQQFLDFMESGGMPQDDMLDADHEGSPESNSLDSSNRDLHDKRKSFMESVDEDDDDDDDENAPKRREGDEKQPKKPGRKPLTSEPTSVSHSRIPPQF
jgi:AP-1-like factor